MARRHHTRAALRPTSGRNARSALLPPTEPPSGWASGQWRWLIPTTVLAATGAWLMGVTSGRADGLTRLALVVGGAVLTTVASGTPLWQQHRASESRGDAVLAAQAARVTMRVALEDALDPFVHLIGRIAAAKGEEEKARRRGEAIQLGVATIAVLSDSRRVRVCFYSLNPRTHTLLLEGFAGRAGAPTRALKVSEEGGEAAVELTRDSSWIFVEDTEVEAPPYWWDVDPVYRTLLAGPVATPTAVVGLLTLDALQPGELAEVDLVLVRLIADLLATALMV
jgi:hypothetical protein